MDVRLIESLADAGIDVNSAIERFMGNESLFERFLKKFLEDSNYHDLLAAISSGDSEGALKSSHTLKGICGNLSMNHLFDLLTRQVSLFREQRWKEATEMMSDITESYINITQAIRRNFS